MEDQIPSSNPAVEQQPPTRQITPEQLEQIKARAREMAIMQTYQQQQKPVTYEMPSPSVRPGESIVSPLGAPQPQVVYVRRSLTVAEIALMLLLSCGIVFGLQWSSGVLMNVLPRIEVRMK